MKEFNNWWNEDLLTEDNPFVDGTPAFWAWEGWCAGAKAERELVGEQPAQPEPWEQFCDSNCVWTDHHPDCKVAQRKPVGVKSRFGDYIEIERVGDGIEISWVQGCEATHGEKHYAYQQAQQEPVACANGCRGFVKHFPPAQRKPLTDEQVSLIASNIDSNDWNDLTFKKCWNEGFKTGFREAEIEHNIKDTP